MYTENYWSGRTVTMTGATGFIGYHLAKRLAVSGARVVALVRSGSIFNRLRGIGIDCVVAPLDQTSAMANAATGSDLFFHLAGAVDFGNDLAKCRHVNVDGTGNALQAAKAAGVRRFIQVSSIVAVGADQTPNALDETATWNLSRYRVPYATTKRQAEELVLQHSGQPEVVVANPSCVIGPEDFAHSEFGTICKRFWRGRMPFYSGKGNNFVDVRDVAAGLMLAAEKGRAGERYILGGENLTYAEFFRMLARVGGRWRLRMRMPLVLVRLSALIADQLPRKKSRPYLTRAQARLLGLWFYFDSSKAKRELGYAPRPVAESLVDSHEFWMHKNAA